MKPAEHIADPGAEAPREERCSGACAASCIKRKIEELRNKGREREGDEARDREDR